MKATPSAAMARTFTMDWSATELARRRQLSRSSWRRSQRKDPGFNLMTAPGW
jgi:hypothetical protein